MAESQSNPGTGVRERLRTGIDLHQGLEHSLAWLKANSEAIDRLNVFPVPDGDTGTNMVLTLQAAIDEIESRKALTACDVAAAAARGSLMGARGNSG
ncbi:MAG TPA: DAK2 domain-containing protein, partial [Chloroflexota bacterium]|nr:DAK2 domain-containing protein [Chloroflexota bacterium]